LSFLIEVVAMEEDAALIDESVITLPLSGSLLSGTLSDSKGSNESLLDDNNDGIVGVKGSSSVPPPLCKHVHPSCIWNALEGAARGFVIGYGFRAVLGLFSTLALKRVFK
jgi:hypothetical protein